MFNLMLTPLFKQSHFTTSHKAEIKLTFFFFKTWLLVPDKVRICMKLEISDNNQNKDMSKEEKTPEIMFS